MAILTDQEKAKLEQLKKLKHDTQKEVTERVSNELRKERLDNERMDAVMDFFFELTGNPMTTEQYDRYNENFKKAKKGYNIKSFIRDENIEKKPEVHLKSHEQILKEEFIEIQADKILEEHQKFKQNEAKNTPTN